LQKGTSEGIRFLNGKVCGCFRNCSRVGDMRDRGIWGTLGRACLALRIGGYAVIVACSTLCFGRHSLDEALRVIREMHFAKADLAIHSVGPHLRPVDVMADVGKMAQRLKASNVSFAAFHLEFDPVDGTEVREQLKAVCRLARLLAVPVVTIAADVVASDFTAEVKRLTEWVKIAEGDGIILTVETRAGTLTETPAAAVELCKKVTGLGITLDPTHYMTVGYDAIIPHVRHVRLRDSGTAPNQYQMRIGQGVIEYGKIVSQLERSGYDRTLTVDVRDIADSEFPIDSEVRKLKFLLESLA
jgi:sugar phosphate isomerase/epimerase